MHLFSIIDDIDYLNEGVNLEDLELQGLSVKEIISFVNEGLSW